MFNKELRFLSLVFVHVNIIETINIVFWNVILPVFLKYFKKNY
jgi:hypothetical protein